MKYQATFWLKDTRQATTSIICMVYAKGERMRFATGHVVKPSNWSKARQRVKAGDTLAAVINDDLDRIALEIGRIILKLQNAGRLTVEAIRHEYEAQKVKQETEVDFLTAYDSFITDSHFRPATQTNHRKAKSHIKKFAETYGIDLTFGRLDLLTWTQFVRYLLTVKGMTNESAWNVTKSVKAFVASTHEKGIHGNESFRRVSKARLVPKSESNSDLAYLTEGELTAVLDLDLSDNDKLRKVRDLFAFLCYTGIRYGDSQAIAPENRQGSTLVFVTGKNRKRATVPLLPEALRIWEMYEGELPKISNQKGNEYLTEVLKRAKLDTPVTSVRFRGTERIETQEPKHEAIGLHSGKRTFVSLSLSRGATIEELARVTGNTPATLQGYDVRTAEEAAESVREAWS